MRQDDPPPSARVRQRRHARRGNPDHRLGSAQGQRALGPLGWGCAAEPARRPAPRPPRAARSGFDWPAPAPVYGKIEEEGGELREAVAAHDADAVAAEAGDLLFACVNLARHLDVDAEAALRGANAKFERRFRAVEAAAHENGEDLAEVGLDRLDALWNAAKRGET